jgi:hypothetical protein
MQKMIWTLSESNLSLLSHSTMHFPQNIKIKRYFSCQNEGASMVGVPKRIVPTLKSIHISVSKESSL